MRRSILLGSRVAAVAMCVASSAVIAARCAPLSLRDGVAIVDLLAKMAAELEMLEGKPDRLLAW